MDSQLWVMVQQLMKHHQAADRHLSTMIGLTTTMDPAKGDEVMATMIEHHQGCIAELGHEMVLATRIAVQAFEIATQKYAEHLRKG